MLGNLLGLSEAKSQEVVGSEEGGGGRQRSRRVQEGISEKSRDAISLASSVSGSSGENGFADKRP